MASGSSRVQRFGVFELDLSSGELRKSGVRVRLQEQPFQVLKALVERPGEVVSREELQQRLWPGETFVDFEDGLSTAVRKIRQALGDSAGAPRYLETLPKRGYRFIAPVSGDATDGSKPPSHPGSAGPPGRRRILFFAVALALLAALIWKNGPDETPSRWVLSRATVDSELTFEPTLSADSKLLAYSSDRGAGGDLNIWVQQVGESQPIQLTFSTADDYEPAFSPDGTEIAFTSDRDPKGIYVVSTFGGELRLLAKDGERARYSPDGKWVAFQPGWRSPIHLVAPEGGQPQTLLLLEYPEKIGVNRPLWFPDSQSFLFSLSIRDWVIARLDGTTTATRALQVIDRHQLRYPYRAGFRPVAETWLSEADGDRIVFSGALNDSVNLWSIPISRRTGVIGEELEQITQGPGFHVHPWAPRDGTIAFANLERTVDLWSLCIDPNTGVVCGELERMTNDVASEFDPTLSSDGRKMLFTSDRGGNIDVWIRDMESGEDRRLTFTPEDEDTAAVLSPDGTQAVYRDSAGLV